MHTNGNSLIFFVCMLHTFHAILQVKKYDTISCSWFFDGLRHVYGISI